MEVISASKKLKTFQQDIVWRDVNSLKGQVHGKQNISEYFGWNTVFLYAVTVIFFGVLVFSLVNLQIVRGRKYSTLSELNRLEEHIIQPDRGIIYDRNGKKLAINIPSFNLMIDPQNVNPEILKEEFRIISEVTGVDQSELMDKFDKVVSDEPLTSRLILVQDISRDQVLEIHSNQNDLPGVWVDYSTKREYLGGDSFSHIIGYTGEASAEVVDAVDGVEMGDIVGMDGIEYWYDEKLRGKKGTKIIEIDASQKLIAEYVNSGTAPIPGDSLYLTIDYDAQVKLDELLKAGVAEYGATGGAAVLQDPYTGEIIASVSVPNYDNNLFIGGISQDDYDKFINDSGIPLFNRVTNAQMPPGSMFKTIVGSAALEYGTATPDTVYVSSGTIYLGGTLPFQEYQGHAYGSLNFVQGLARSSNIYFCQTMLALGIDNFIDYAEFYGVGSQTGIDIPGEQSGMLPSPENKIELAKNNPYLDPVWYEEGDACNSAIGQGITLATPMQVVGWSATISNGGKVIQPHYSYKWESVTTGVNSEKSYTMVEDNVLREGKLSDSTLYYIKEGMRNSVSGPYSIIVPLGQSKVEVAAKTGTAEFGVKDETGYYTKTHAWVMGFFPYDNPKYSFVIFLEGGGASNNAAEVALQYIDWLADNGYLEN
ncbi:penicillin-binding protein 2 [Candidatus Dojkabacteria bacterium]|nr:penicillin-binding protein 2 [Candidatus Dojkabacteria bacterium]